jgi:uncharacterized protein (TIGR03067 family)
VKREWLVLLLIILPVAVSARPADDPAKPDGTWLPLSAELGGKPLPDAVLKAMKLVVEGEKYTVTVGEGVDRGTCKVDAGKTPKTMDITGTDGPNKGRTILAIFELKGDTLRVCYDLGGKARPAEFASKSGETPLFLVTYRREKP